MEKPLNIKDKSVLAYIECLEDKLKTYEESPYFDSYITIYNQLKSFNEQLRIGEEQTTIGENGIQITTKKGFIDLFAEKEDKSFDRTKWYFEQILELNKTLDSLRKLMTPEQQRDVAQKKLIENAGMAEKIALHNGKAV